MMDVGFYSSMGTILLPRLSKQRPPTLDCNTGSAWTSKLCRKMAQHMENDTKRQWLYTLLGSRYFWDPPGVLVVWRWLPEGFLKGT